MSDTYRKDKAKRKLRRERMLRRRVDMTDAEALWELREEWQGGAEDERVGELDEVTGMVVGEVLCAGAEWEGGLEVDGDAEVGVCVEKVDGGG